jgi:serine/threonine-protein kinase
MYGAVGFVVVQAADVFVPALRLPEWILSAVAFLVILGFPLALVLAWAFERTPEGVKRTEDAAPGELSSIVGLPAKARWPIGIAALVGTGLLAFVVINALRTSDISNSGAEGTETQVALAGVLDPNKLAVLPFRNLASDESDERFSLGVHDDILTRLQRIRTLKVMTRNSVLEFADTELGTTQIADQLGAAYLLTGSVQRAGDRLRINVHLADARGDETVWTNTFDETWSVDNLLEIQARIAEEVASGLSVTLSPTERTAITEPATRSLEAYDYFLLADELRTAGFSESVLRSALDYANRAVGIDPEFALGWAMVGYAHANLYHQSFDRTPQRLGTAKAAIDRALALGPDVPEAHTALGYYYYWGFLEYDRALEAFSRAEDIAPSSRWLLSGVGSVMRRQGRMEEALRYYRRALELEPGRPTVGASVAETLNLLRRHTEATDVYATMVEPWSTDGALAAGYALALIQRDGDTRAARGVMRRARERGLQSFGLSFGEVRVELIDRDPEAALNVLDRAEAVIGDRQYFYYPKDLVRGWAYGLTGDSEAARSAYESAVIELGAARTEFPDDVRIAGALGLAYAGLGQREEAIAEGRRATELLPIDKEAWRGATHLEELGMIYAALGDVDDALAVIETLLSRPGELTVTMLRLDPAWDNLRGDLRFQALIGN